jgi:hypothetical protein
VHGKLVLVGLDELAEGLPVPVPGPADQIRGHDRILPSLLPLAPRGKRAGLPTRADTVRAANRALRRRPVRRTAGVYLTEINDPSPTGKEQQ